MPRLERYLEGKHAVVTGGSRGIGAAIAAALVDRGARVTIMGRSAETLEQQAQKLRGERGVTVSVEECDVSDAESVSNAFCSIGAHARAGSDSRQQRRNREEPIVHGDDARDMGRDDRREPHRERICAPRRWCPGMIEAKSGRIVNVASTAGLRGYKTMAAYCASKHGVIGLTRALAQETAKLGITVNAVCPSYIETDLRATLFRISSRTSARVKTRRWE